MERLQQDVEDLKKSYIKEASPLLKKSYQQLAELHSKKLRMLPHVLINIVTNKANPKRKKEKISCASSNSSSFSTCKSPSSSNKLYGIASNESYDNFSKGNSTKNYPPKRSITSLQNYGLENNKHTISYENSDSRHIMLEFTPNVFADTNVSIPVSLSPLLPNKFQKQAYSKDVKIKGRNAITGRPVFKV
ncbi:unnamed protein product [Blepharisma stoltei]|uniref:Uncharacterized protein n=1 Tax=Blepharisma stoltei TaxID=1481888 RepID=A0AAU9KFI8_9CILI|nr:unnamed protein product [Blepharisma stoltei]